MKTEIWKWSNLSCYVQESVNLTPQFLGAVTALAWLGSLSFPDVQSSSSDVTHDHCNFSQVVRCFSKLPANLTIVKQEQLYHGGQRHSSDTSTSGENQKPIEWGPLMSHCFLSYWKCILCTLKYLHDNSPHPFSSGSSSSNYPLGAAPHPTDDTVAVGAINVLGLAQCCLDSLDMAGPDLAVLIECLAVLVPKVQLLSCFIVSCCC